MKLCYGAIMAFTEIALLLCFTNKDFGRGVYLTPERKDAANMARRYGELLRVLLFDLRDSGLEDVPVRQFVRLDDKVR